MLNNAVLSNVAFPAMEKIKNDARFAGKVENAGNLIVGIDPWTCAPVLKPLDPYATAP